MERIRTIRNGREEMRLRTDENMTVLTAKGEHEKLEGFIRYSPALLERETVEINTITPSEDDRVEAIKIKEAFMELMENDNRDSYFGSLFERVKKLLMKYKDGLFSDATGE